MAVSQPSLSTPLIFIVQKSVHPWDHEELQQYINAEVRVVFVENVALNDLPVKEVPAVCLGMSDGSRKSMSGLLNIYNLLRGLGVVQDAASLRKFLGSPATDHILNAQLKAQAPSARPETMMAQQIPQIQGQPQMQMQAPAQPQMQSLPQINVRPHGQQSSQIQPPKDVMQAPTDIRATGTDVSMFGDPQMREGGGQASGNVFESLANDPAALMSTMRCSDNPNTGGRVALKRGPKLCSRGDPSTAASVGLSAGASGDDFIKAREQELQQLYAKHIQPSSGSEPQLPTIHVPRKSRAE